MRTALTFAALLAVALPAHAELYRWVDSNGVVNYSGTRPQGAKDVKTLNDETSRVSVVPGPTAEEFARMRERELELRIARLERELADQRAREAMAAYAPYPASYGGYDGYYGNYGGYAGLYPGYAVYPGYFAYRRFPPRFVRPPIVRSPIARSVMVRPHGVRVAVGRR